MIESLEPTSNPYLCIHDAVWAVEQLDKVTVPFHAWSKLMETNRSPAEAVVFFQHVLGLMLENDPTFARLARARSQMDDPSFLTYIAGRMGAV